MFGLYLVIGQQDCKYLDIMKTVERAVEGGVSAVQLREKTLDTKPFLELAFRMKDFLKSKYIPLFINDRPDIAIAVRADGIHIGQNDMPYKILRTMIPSKMLVGLSVETIEQAQEAELYDVDYLGISPVFSTPSKTDFNEKPWGIEGLKRLRRISKHPLIAIGGINSQNANNVIMAGADGIAVISAICSSPDPLKASHELKMIVSNAKRTMSN